MGQVLTRSWYNYNTIYHIDFCMAWYNLCWTSLITAWQHGAWSGVGTVGGAMFGILCKGCTLFSLRTLCWYVDLIYLFKEAWKTGFAGFCFRNFEPRLLTFHSFDKTEGSESAMSSAGNVMRCISLLPSSSPISWNTCHVCFCWCGHEITPSNSFYKFSDFGYFWALKPTWLIWWMAADLRNASPKAPGHK